MTSQAFPIQLEQVLFTRSIVIAIPSHERSERTPLSAAENGINALEIDAESGRYQVTMTCKMNLVGDSAYPYIIDMECIGAFVVDNTLSKAEALKGVTIIAHNVLYGAIRESVAWITSRQPHGPLMLGLSVLQGQNQDKPPPPEK